MSLGRMRDEWEEVLGMWAHAEVLTGPWADPVKCVPQQLSTLWTGIKTGCFLLIFLTSKSSLAVSNNISFLLLINKCAGSKVNQQEKLTPHKHLVKGRGALVEGLVLLWIWPGVAVPSPQSAQILYGLYAGRKVHTSPRAGNFTVEWCNPVSHRIFWGLPDGLGAYSHPWGHWQRWTPQAGGAVSTESILQTQKRCPAKGFAPFPYLTPCSGGQGCPGQLLGMPLGIIRDNAVGVGAMVCLHPSK